jgi:hypothetical protein
VRDGGGSVPRQRRRRGACRWAGELRWTSLQIGVEETGPDVARTELSSTRRQRWRTTMRGAAPPVIGLGEEGVRRLHDTEECPRRRIKGENGSLWTANRRQRHRVALFMAAGKSGSVGDSVSFLGRGFAGEPQEGVTRSIWCLVGAVEAVVTVGVVERQWWRRKLGLVGER